ncbi:hypothetical protein [Cellulomonas sp.]|uniref:hypothetical protein n=1 Tax=Cellulomonas sp. TaxID=40001 RepID=UPI001AFDB95D|nr:hypothetical protein [Cellulomonas sp.]MBO9553223.1 hypothetical protein [Cellulomonas sp.]
MRDLEVGDELTIGIPNRYFIDGQVLVRREHEVVEFPEDGELHECLGVCAPMHYWTWVASSQRNPVMQWWPVDYAWVYRDAVPPGAPTTDALGMREADDGSRWLRRVRPDAIQPPVREAVPAREVGALTGRALRSRNAAGEWFWFVGVSEPIAIDGDICVHAVPDSHWWLHQVDYYRELQDKMRPIPLHRLFAYV